MADVPLSPVDAIRTAKSIANVYATAATELTRIVAAQAARGVHSGTAVAQLAQLNALQAEAEKVVAAAQAAGPREAVRLVEQAYAGGLRKSASELLAVNQRSVAAIARSAVLPTLDRAGPLMLRWVDDAYRAVLAETAPLAVAGSLTVDQAAARAVDRLATMGVTGFTDATGATWRIESYAEMATRTAVMRAHLQGTVDRIQGQGHDLVIVSDSPGECERCRPYEGQVFSLSGESLEYPALAEAGGLFHPNCTHTVSRFTPGLTHRPSHTADPEGNAARVRLRELERRVRESRRRVAALEQMRDPALLAEQRALLSRRLADMRRHLRESGLEHKGFRASLRSSASRSGIPTTPARREAAPWSDADYDRRYDAWGEPVRGTPEYDQWSPYRISGSGMNTRLRFPEEEIKFAGAYDEQVADFDRFWQHHATQLDEDTLLWRGVYANPHFDPADWKVGQNVVEPGWSSTTNDMKNVMIGHPAWRLKITAAKGTRIVFGERGQREVILPRNTRFKVTRVDHDDRLVELEVEK